MSPGCITWRFSPHRQFLEIHRGTLSQVRGGTMCRHRILGFVSWEVVTVLFFMKLLEGRSAFESQMRKNLKSKTHCLETCLQDRSLSASDAFFYTREKRLLYQQPFSILMRTRSHISRALIHAVMFWRLLQSLSNLHPKHSWDGS